MLSLESTIAFTVIFFLLLGILGFFIDIALETYLVIEQENQFLTTVNGAADAKGRLPDAAQRIDIDTFDYILLKRFKCQASFEIDNEVNAALGIASHEMQFERQDFQFVHRRILMAQQYLGALTDLLGGD
jgi:hypothetical protein